MSKELIVPISATLDTPHITVSPGWLRLADAVLPHQPTAGGCQCGWRIEDYDWPEWGEKTESERWVEHVRSKATSALPHTEAVYIYDNEGVQHVLSTDSVVVHHTSHYGQSCREAFSSYHGEYHLPDYQRPSAAPNEVRMTPLTCQEAGCRDPHCSAAHLTFSMADIVRAARNATPSETSE